MFLNLTFDLSPPTVHAGARPAGRVNHLPSYPVDVLEWRFVNKLDKGQAFKQDSGLTKEDAFDAIWLGSKLLDIQLPRFFDSLLVVDASAHISQHRWDRMKGQISSLREKRQRLEFGAAGYLGLRAIHHQVRAVDPEKASVVHLCRFFGTDKSARETSLLQSFLESNSDFQAYWEELEPNDQAVDSSSGEEQTNFRSILSNPDSFKGYPHYEQLARTLAYAWLVDKIAWDENSRKAWKDLIGLLDCGEHVGILGFLPPGIR
ncbi:hypothetical protein BDZ88DRAFT_456217 [Geranomyces variabilis]|nr:hypothetical protein BDZ88DRAFT_456217 [Geranomyces variabilis]KAJ3134310.1 hypothetical protein HDU90_005176 [Geranomyces variabilis]